MLNTIRKLTVKNYDNNNCPPLQNIETIKNILFLKQQITESLLQNITNPTNYNIIKQILFQLLPNISPQIHSAFIDLENNGLDSFKPYNKLDIKIQTIINEKYKFLFEDLYTCDIIKICYKNSSSVFTKSRDTILHTGILKLIQLINEDMFVPYTIFDDYKFTDLISYKTNTFFSNIFVATNSNIEQSLTKNQLLLLCNISSAMILTLSNILKINVDGLFIDLILYMSPAKKMCPNIKQTMKREHINSGSTTIYYDKTHGNPLIKMYREEELVKVLLHELIHACRFDDLFEDYPKHEFKVTRKQLLFTESITECFARLINIILYSHIYGKNFTEILNDEIQFGLIQTAKILHNFGFESVKDFLNIDINDKRKIKQETSVFEYYILASILLIKINEFLEIIGKKGTINDVVALIMNTFNSNDYQNKVDNIIGKIHNIDEVIIQTCKMTVIKIDLCNTVNYNKCKLKYLECKNKQC